MGIKRRSILFCHGGGLVGSPPTLILGYGLVVRCELSAIRCKVASYKRQKQRSKAKTGRFSLVLRWCYAGATLVLRWCYASGLKQAQQTRIQGDFDRARRTDQPLVTAEQINDL